MKTKRQSLPGTYTRKLLKAIKEFDLIRPGDKVLIGFSGGKDSAFLIYALSIFHKQGIIPFKLGALTIDLGFKPPLDIEVLANYCAGLGVEFFVHRTEISRYAFGEDNPEGPCARCSFLRRGALNRFAGEHGYNVVALAHHHDDAVETFLMNIIFSGKIKTFLPRTEQERSKVTVIRPLIYFREDELKRTVELTGFTPVPSPCPIDGRTKRADTKELINKLTSCDNRVFWNLASAMREGRPIELWPPEPSPEEQRDKKNLLK
jgi:tRNA 2-thiocytidine biosynthesis protein TtcA